MKPKTVQLDVREDIRNGREPFGRIMATAQQLGPEDRLKLLAPFEPMPLYTFLGNRGFAHSAKELADGSWEILFARGDSAEPATCNVQPATRPHRPTPGPSQEGSRKGKRGAVVECDVRGLEPPEPMVKILEAVASLPAGVEMLARTDRRPMHLYPQLEARGFRADTTEQPDGSYLTRISHA
jgi:uncharacterized protein (DUF2249 family)